MTAFRVRDRSYRVQRDIQPGERVRFTAPTYSGGQIQAGAEGTLRGYTNAGFRGIEAHIDLDSGRTAYGISAGLLERADAR
jgi:hypothetical protein